MDILLSDSNERVLLIDLYSVWFAFMTNVILPLCLHDHMSAGLKKSNKRQANMNSESCVILRKLVRVRFHWRNWQKYCGTKVRWAVDLFRAGERPEAENTAPWGNQFSVLQFSWHFMKMEPRGWAKSRLSQPPPGGTHTSFDRFFEI